jgi:hypothetical protein
MITINVNVFHVPEPPIKNMDIDSFEFFFYTKCHKKLYVAFHLRNERCLQIMNMNEFHLSLVVMNK